MNNLSNERLKEISEDGFLEHGESKAMARELLACREAQGKPYAFTTESEMLHVRHGSNGYIMNVSRIGDFSDAIPLFAAPQSPVWFGIDWAAPQMPVVPDGWALVPIEPTEEMMLHKSECQHHAWDDHDCAMRQTRRLVWANMIAAAPKPETQR